MANCSKCSEKLGFFNDTGNGMCLKCHQKQLEAHSSVADTENDELLEQKLIQSETELRLKQETAAINAIMLTTETAPSLNITRRIEIITAECAFGMNIFKDLFAGIRDIVGGRSEAVQKTMRDARKTALFELKREAYLVVANAVVGVDLDYTEISANSNMIMLVASGTAVIIEE